MVSQPDALYDYPNNYAIVRERVLQSSQHQEGQGLLRSYYSIIFYSVIIYSGNYLLHVKYNIRMVSVLDITYTIAQTKDTLKKMFKLQKKSLLFL